VIQLEAGRYQVPRRLDIAVAGLTIRGRGPEQNVLSLQGQMMVARGSRRPAEIFCWSRRRSKTPPAMPSSTVLGGKTSVFSGSARGINNPRRILDRT